MSKKKKSNNNPKALEQQMESLEVELELKTEDKEAVKADEMIELIDINDEDYAEALEEDEFSDVEFISQDDKKKKTRKYVAYQVFRTVVTMIALVAFAYASYELALVYLENDTTFEAKDEISNMFLQDVDDLGNGNVVLNSNGETIVMENSSNGKAFVWDYQKMLDYNSEAKGYIRQDNGDYIDYPILQHSDNDYYLYHLPNHTWSSMGSIFIDYRIKDGLKADYCIIYGHYIGKRANNIMFGSLNWYWDWPYYHKEHPDFDIYVEDRHYKYYVFSIMKVPAAGDRVYNPEFESDEARLEFLQDVKAQSKYTFDKAPELTKDSKVIMLSTCTTDKQVRFVMFLVRGEEIYDVPGVDYDNLPSEEETSSKEETSSSQEETTAPQEPSEEQTAPDDNPGPSDEPSNEPSDTTPDGSSSSSDGSGTTSSPGEDTTSPPVESDTTTEPPSTEGGTSEDETTPPSETESSDDTSDDTTAADPGTSDSEGDTTDNPSLEEQTTPME